MDQRLSSAQPEHDAGAWCSGNKSLLVGRFGRVAGVRVAPSSAPSSLSSSWEQRAKPRGCQASLQGRKPEPPGAICDAARARGRCSRRAGFVAGLLARHGKRCSGSRRTQHAPFLTRPADLVFGPSAPTQHPKGREAPRRLLPPGGPLQQADLTCPMRLPYSHEIEKPASVRRPAPRELRQTITAARACALSCRSQRSTGRSWRA